MKSDKQRKKRQDATQAVKAASAKASDTSSTESSTPVSQSSGPVLPPMTLETLSVLQESMKGSSISDTNVSELTKLLLGDKYKPEHDSIVSKALNIIMPHVKAAQESESKVLSHELVAEDISKHFGINKDTILQSVQKTQEEFNKHLEQHVMNNPTELVQECVPEIVTEPETKSTKSTESTE